MGAGRMPVFACGGVRQQSTAESSTPGGAFALAPWAASSSCAASFGRRGSAARHPPELDGGAAVHDDRQAARGGDAGALPVHYVELEPQRAGPHGDGVAGDLLGQLGPAEDVDDVDGAAAAASARVATAGTPRTTVSFGLTGTHS